MKKLLLLAIALFAFNACDDDNDPAAIFWPILSIVPISRRFDFKTY